MNLLLFFLYLMLDSKTIFVKFTLNANFVVRFFEMKNKVTNFISLMRLVYFVILLFTGYMPFVNYIRMCIDSTGNCLADAID